MFSNFYILRIFLNILVNYVSTFCCFIFVWRILYSQAKVCIFVLWCMVGSLEMVRLVLLIANCSCFQYLKIIPFKLLIMLFSFMFCKLLCLGLESRKDSFMIVCVCVCVCVTLEINKNAGELLEELNMINYCIRLNPAQLLNPG